MSDFKKSSKRRNVRKKKSSSESDESLTVSSVIRSDKKGAAHNPLKTSSCPVKKPRVVSKF